MKKWRKIKAKNILTTLNSFYLNKEKSQSITSSSDTVLYAFVLK